MPGLNHTSSFDRGMHGLLQSTSFDRSTPPDNNGSQLHTMLMSSGDGYEVHRTTMAGSNLMPPQLALERVLEG